jgi:proteasome accessory factor B
MKFNMSCPLEYDAHRKGWHYTDAGFFLPLVFASGTEFQAIKVIGELVAQYDGTPLGDMMEKALERVLSLFKDSDAHAVRQLTERICFAGLPTIPIDPDVWAAVLTALQRDQRLKLQYRKGGNDPAVERLYDPFGLIVRGRDWFLHGFCHLHGKRSNLYLPYVKAAMAVDEYFDLPKDFSLREYTKAGFHGLQSNEREMHKVVLRFIPEMASVMEMHRFAHDQTVKRDSRGHAVVTFRASALFQVEREVLSWGGKVEVIGPPALRDRMRQVIGDLRKTYGKA